MARTPKFRGRFTHKMDSKGRVSIPSEFRTVLEKIVEASGEYDENDKTKVVAALTYDRSIEVYPVKEWEDLEERLDSAGYLNEAAGNVRVVLGNCADLQIDASGRLLIPSWMRADARLGVQTEDCPGLELDNEMVVIVGKGRSFEIWQPKFWDKRIEQARRHREENPADYDKLQI